jgi:clan AA aspartic protease
MIFGVVRGYSPRLPLMLPGKDGPFEVEFVADTGFEGELALSQSLAERLDAHTFQHRTVLMADGTRRECMLCYIAVEWNEESRLTEVLVLEGNPLLGMYFMEGHHLHVEAIEGGEVCLEPL